MESSFSQVFYKKYNSYKTVKIENVVYWANDTDRVQWNRDNINNKGRYEVISSAGRGRESYEETTCVEEENPIVWVCVKSESPVAARVR